MDYKSTNLYTAHLQSLQSFSSSCAAHQWVAVKTKGAEMPSDSLQQSQMVFKNSFAIIHCVSLNIY